MSSHRRCLVWTLVDLVKLNSTIFGITADLQYVAYNKNLSFMHYCLFLYEQGLIDDNTEQCKIKTIKLQKY
jgi:hypothetical protein